MAPGAEHTPLSSEKGFPQQQFATIQPEELQRGRRWLIRPSSVLPLRGVGWGRGEGMFTITVT